MPKSSSLSLAMRSKPGKDINSPAVSPRSPDSPSTLYPNEGELATPTAPFHNTPASPASPKLRKDSKSIFANFSATKSSSRIMTPENGSIRQVADHDASSNLYANGRHGGSTPDLNRPVRTPNSDDNRSLAGPEQRTGSSDPNADKRNGAKAKKQGMLSRSKSIKTEERTKLNKQHPPKLSPDATATWTTNGEGISLKTAPLDKGQSWRQNISFGKLRTHSADRHDGTLQVHRDDDASLRRDKAEQNSVASGSYNESRGATLMSSLGSGARKMGEKMDSARKGMFGKLGRTSSNHEREPQLPKEPYQFKIIHTPLVEQTRLTRISQRLEHSRDKTEFWMPALPWRCIDYLNMKGCEEEGLYRVPGAAHQIKYYEQKFDQDRDIDLIADENLNDPNVIGSLFKNWLRQLPDEIFPKSIQAQIQHECQGAKSTPQMLKDELSKLPPFNYYLLFAITCHISLLHSCSEFNKMNYNNLCICFQPAIKIDAFCFQFLILDWRNCWQGCWTEKEYLAEEMALLESLENPKPQQPLSQNQNQTQTPSRNGQAAQGSSKNKGSQASTYLGEALKSTQRSNSTDRNAPAMRGISSERSGRVTPPNSSMLSSEKSISSKRDTPSDRDSSTDRAVSPESREYYNVRATPKRAPPSVNTEHSLDEDNGTTPTQLQHSRGPSETQFRLDLSNPPSSPFTIKF